MAQKFRDEKFRTEADIRPGFDPDPRSKPSKSGDYAASDTGGAKPYPGYPGPNSDLRNGGANIANTSIRSVRVGELPGYGAGNLGSMEIAGKVVNVPKVPPMQKFAPRPIQGAGPLEMQRLEQQQRNAIAMGDPDYAPMRELDYESVKEANFGKAGKSASKAD